MFPPVLALCLTALLGAAPEGSPLARPPGEQHAPRLPEPVEQEEAEHVELAVGGVVLAGFEQGQHHRLLGGVLAVTFPLVPQRLELEAVVQLLFADGETALPLDLLLVLPFAGGHRLTPYLGLGPSLVPISGEEGWTLVLGAASTLGIVFWPTEAVGLFVEANANALNHHGLLIELGGAGGLVISL